MYKICVCIYIYIQLYTRVCVCAFTCSKLVVPRGSWVPRFFSLSWGVGGSEGSIPFVGCCFTCDSCSKHVFLFSGNNCFSSEERVTHLRESDGQGRQFPNTRVHKHKMGSEPSKGIPNILKYFRRSPKSLKYT